jgi:hypothetical protein
MQVRPFVLLGATVLDTVQAALDGAARQWARDWGVAEHALALTCGRAADGAGVPAGTWRQRRSEGERSVWLAWPAGLARDIGRALFATDAAAAPAHAAPLACAAADAALAQLLDVLAGVALGGAPGLAGEAAQGPAPAAFARGAGTVAARLAIGSHSLHCLLEADCVRALAPRAAADPAVQDLAPLDYWHLVRDVPVTLPVRIGGAEVGMGSLLSLAAGDIIRLDSCVDDPVAITGPDGAALFKAYLGQVGGLLAVEIGNRT